MIHITPVYTKHPNTFVFNNSTILTLPYILVEVTVCTQLRAVGPLHAFYNYYFQVIRWYTYMDVHSSIYCAFLQFPVLRRKEPSDDVHPS